MALSIIDEKGTKAYRAVENADYQTQANAFRSLLNEKMKQFQNDAAQPGSIFEPAYAKGGLEFFRYVEDGRMAYVGSVKDDTEKILGREQLLLREWAKLHANELRLRVANTGAPDLFTTTSR